MIKKLRLRFIIAALLSILFVLSATIAAININNYIKTENENTSAIREIIVREHYKTESMLTGGGYMGGRMPGGNPTQPGQPQQPNDYSNNVTNREHYFIVVYNEDSSFRYSNFSHIFTITEEDGMEMAQKFFESGKSSKKEGNLRYHQEVKVVYAPGSAIYSFPPIVSTYVVCLDAQDRMHSFDNFLISSLVIAAIAYTALAGLIIISSHFIFKTSEESYRKQKAFVTNASHELKTPLTIISTDLELIKMDHGDNEWIDSIDDQVRRLTIMTKQLVTLSKLDESDLKNFPFTNLSLSKIANESVSSFLPLYEKNNYKFNSDIDEDIEIKGNNNLINELFYIFMDNANKYATPKGEIGLSIKKDNKNKIKVTFYNDIEDDEIDVNQMFERFYRSPNSNKKEGSGIGLSIAKEIIDLHKGKVKTSLKDNKIYFEITF